MLIQLIVTSQMIDHKFERFIDSIIENKYCNLHLIFINQSGSKYWLNSNSNNIKFTQVMSKKISLSKARNLGMNYLVKDKEYILSFPDDDCWYYNTFLDDINNMFKISKYDIICFNVFDPYKHKNFGCRPRYVKKSIQFYNIFKYPISVGIFLKIKNNDIVFFDERFGIGTSNFSGEETIFLAKYFSKGYKCIYDGNFSVYHEVYDITSEQKLLNYSYGTAKTIKLLCYLYHKKYLFCLVELLLRSLIGYIFRLNTFYLKRFKYLLKGFYDSY